MQIQRFSFLVLFLFFSLVILGQNRTDYALFFVTTDFDYWDDFPSSSARQVEEIKRELETNYGFKAEIVYNPTRRQTIGKLLEYQKKRFGSKDQLLVYFSQHGHYEEGMAGALIPKDGPLTDPYQEKWIRHPLLADMVNGIPCEHLILALDACYSGTFGGARGKPLRPAYENEESCDAKTTNALQYKSRIYLTSGGKERTPQDSKFADKFLAALRLKNYDGVLSFSELYGVVSEAYPRPRYGNFKDHIQGGDFIFVNQSKCQPNTKISDESHWLQTKQQPTQAVIFEHIRLYPECRHGVEISNLLSKNATPSNTSASNSTGGKITIGEKLPATDLDNMVFVQGGTFQMGSKDGSSDEKPVHSVTVSDFYIARHEVTFEEFDAFCNATGKDLADDENWGRDTRPVINVSWYDAVEYCNWKSEQQRLQPVYTINGENITANWNANGYRLPTEAEWEFAARSRGKNEKWAGTSSESQLADYGNYYEGDNKGKDGYKYTAPVGSFSENNLGLFDMSGNVWEWCWDWKDAGYYAESKNSTNPKGPNNGSNRVQRGGSWNGTPSYLRCANRSRGNPSYRGSDIGFRLSRAGR